MTISSSDPFPAFPLQRETRYEYDGRNRLKTTTEPSRQNQQNPVTTFDYDVAGNKTKVTLPGPEQYTQEWSDYDAFGQARTFKNENQKITNLTYRWGPMKKLETVRTYRDMDDGAGQETQLTSFDYDGMGRLRKTVFPDTTMVVTEESTYRFGQLETWKTRRNQTKRLFYDARGREYYHTWDNDAAPGITRIWDDANRLRSISNIFSTIDYGYDDAGQVTWEGNSIAGTGRTEIRYCRYPSGEVSQMTYPNGTVINRFYTPRGQLKGVDWGVGSTSYEYNPDGTVDLQAWDHVSTKYGYDGRGMVSSILHRNTAAGRDLARRDYWRDDRDRIKAWKRGIDNSLNGMEDGRGDRYEYDPEGQLKIASYRVATPEGSPGVALRTDIFHYDELGNRVRGNHIASLGWMDIMRRNNGLNQYQSWENDRTDAHHWGSGIFHDDNIPPPAPSPPPATPPPNPWVSPGNGVLMEDGYVVAGFNALNQPVGIWSFAFQNTPNWMFFGYDPLGRCVKRWVGPHVDGHVPPANTNPATYYYYDGWNLVQEGPSGASADIVYVHGGRVDEIVASKAGGNWRQHHYDAGGNCILLTNSITGAILEQYDYDAFGRPYFYSAGGYGLGLSSPQGNRFLFTGREWIKELRLYDYRNRMYQPELGRFLQPDPKEFTAGDYNLYRYCHNDPVNKSDPTGLRSEMAVEIMRDRLWDFACRGDSGNSFQGDSNEYINRGHDHHAMGDGESGRGASESGGRDAGAHRTGEGNKNSGASPYSGTGYTISRKQVAEYHGWGLLYRSDVGFNYTLRDPEHQPVRNIFVKEQIRLSEKHGFVASSTKTGGYTTDKNGVIGDHYGAWFLQNSSSVRVTQTLSIENIGSARWSGVLHAGGRFVPDQASVEFIQQR